VEWLIALAQALLAAGAAYGAMNVRVRMLEKREDRYEAHIDACLSELSRRIDTLTALASRLEGYTNGVRNGRKAV
jgi:biopolymer transport protein ExbB/TolQ